jgi:intracellular septation protein
MKFLFDFFPVIAFFAAFFIPDDRQEAIFIATYTIMIATLIQVSAYWLLYKKFEKMHLITLIVVLIAGGLTVYFRNDLFIKWKPTVINWLFATALISSHFIGDKTLFQRMINLADEKLVLPNQVWRNVNMSWGLFFIFLGFVNLYVAFSFTLEFWVTFKTWGMTSLNLIFLVCIFIYMYQYLKDKEDINTRSQED